VTNVTNRLILPSSAGTDVAAAHLSALMIVLAVLYSVGHMGTGAYIGIATVVVAVMTIVAIIYAPIIALKVQRRGDEAREQKGRKLWIFKTLMGYRATRLNANYVQALNMIDIEFTDKSEKDIRDVWKELLDHYTVWGAKSEIQRKVDEKADLEKSNDLLAEMLVKMGKGLGYQFDKVYIKKGFYYPEGLGNIEQEQHSLRRLLLALLSGNGMKLPVALFTQDFQPLSPAANPGATPPTGLRPPPIRPLSEKGKNGSELEPPL
jgi:hypothetical protein